MQEIDFTKYPQNLRIRHHISANVYFPFNENIKEPERYPPLIDKLDWNIVYKNGKVPEMLDIGCGFGKFLINSSLLFPEMNLLGIEVRPAPVDWIKRVIDGENLINVDVRNYSVANGMPFISDNSIKYATYFFPDPWFKVRHHKRRAFSQKFLEELYRVMESSAKLFLQTDVEEVHKHHIDTLKEFNKFEFKEVVGDEEWKINNIPLPATDHEMYVDKKGMPKYRLICKPRKLWE